MKKAFLLLALFTAALANAAPVTARGTGRNADYRAAIYDALAQAMSQVQGLSLQESRESLLDALEQSKRSTGKEDFTLSDAREALKQSVSAKTEGRILGYEILKEEFDQQTKTWRVEVEAKMPGRYIVGRDPDNLRRMVVMPFHSLTPEFSLDGAKIECAKGCEEIAAALDTCLTHTRKFTMLDRRFNTETLAELSRLDMANSSPADLGRFGQLLVTDYMVIGTVKYLPRAAAVSNSYTGMTAAQDSTFLEISYRVLLVPTSQLKWAGVVKIPYSACGGATGEETLSNAIEYAAETICEEIISNIYPIRVAAHAAFELVLNQGGRNVRIGDEFEVFKRGAPIVDPTNGESLGFTEDMIARIRVTRVTPKASYAIVTEGTPCGDIEIGAIVRRPAWGGAGAYAPQGAATPVQVAPDGGVKVPWM